MIRLANTNDIAQIINLLLQGDMVHFRIRPDIFKPNTTKYNEQELSEMLSDDTKHIFVYDDGGVLGYLFCQITEIGDNSLLQNIKTLYIDDLCVDEICRGHHVGQQLFEFVKKEAVNMGCHHLTLNVWEGNDSARRFYERQGLQIQKTVMEMILDKE